MWDDITYPFTHMNDTWIYEIIYGNTIPRSYGKWNKIPRVLLALYLETLGTWSFGCTRAKCAQYHLGTPWLVSRCAKFAGYHHHFATVSWWRHQMETFSVSLAFCAGNSPVTGEFPAQRPVTRSFDLCFDLRPNKQVSKQTWGFWFETPS